MGTRYYGANRGEQKEDISIDGATTGKAIELAVDDASSLTKQDVVRALESFKARVLEDAEFPGA